MKHVISNAKKLKANNIHFEGGHATASASTSIGDQYTLVQPVDPANSGTYDVSTLAKFDAQSVIDGKVTHRRGTASVKLIDDEDVCKHAEFDESKFVQVPAELFDAIVQAGKVRSNEKFARPVIECVRIENFHVVATDSYRLHVETLPADSGIEGHWHELDSYVKVLGDIVSAYTDEGALYLRNSDGATLICEPTKATMEAHYLNWQSLIPNSFEQSAHITDVAELIKGVKFAGKLLDKKQPLVIECADDKLTIHAIGEDLHNIERFDALMGYADEQVEPTGINAKYLSDALDYVKDSSTSIGFISPRRPILLDNGTRRALVMSVRLSSITLESIATAKAGA